MTDQCSVRRATGREEWHALFGRAEQPHMPQAWAYGEAKGAAGWRVRRLVFERQGEPVAVCQLLEKELAGVPWLTRVNRGPLFLGADPDDGVVRDVYHALRRRSRLRRGVLALAPGLPADAGRHRMMAELGFRERRQRGWASAHVDLRQDEEQLRARLAPTWRNRLRKAEQAGLDVRVSQSEEDVEWMIARHLENMSDKGFSGPTRAMIEGIFLEEPAGVFVLQALRDDRPLGGMMVYRFQHVAEYYIGWFARDGRSANVGNLLYWRSMLEMRERGCRLFDLGGYSVDDRYGHFKRGVRGDEYQLLNEWVAL